MFSYFGLIHDKLRNRLGNKKVAMLVKVYSSFRHDVGNVEANFDSLDLLD